LLPLADALFLSPYQLNPFNYNPLRQLIERVVDFERWSSGFISRTDVADFLVKQINDASLVHKTPALTG
jgi:hypothetical protein